MTPIFLHGSLLHRFRLHTVPDRANSRFREIATASPWIKTLPQRIKALMAENASRRSKLGKLLKLAEEISMAAKPHLACDRGCAHCCSITVALSSDEASLIGNRIGVSPEQVPDGQEETILADSFFGIPCPFLENGECSIYETRPAACRLHCTLDDDSYFCSTEIAPEDSAVPSLDMTPFWLAYAALSLDADARLGDIRQFFPAGKASRGR